MLSDAPMPTATPTVPCAKLKCPLPRVVSAMTSGTSMPSVAAMGGAQVYTTALQCVVNKDLKEEWTEYLDQTKNHIEVVRDLFEKFGLDPEQTPGRQVVHHLAEGLVQAMQMAKKSGKREAPGLAGSSDLMPQFFLQSLYA